MMTACGSISLSHAIAYYEQDEYFTREGKESNFWYGKLREYNKLPQKYERVDYHRVVNENEITRKLRFRYVIPDSLVKQFVDEEFKNKIIGIAKKSIISSLEFAFNKYKSYGLSFPTHDLIRKEKYHNRYIFYVLSNHRFKSKCGFFNKVINDDEILKVYNKKFACLCQENNIEIEKKFFEFANGSIKEQTGRIGTDNTFSLPKSISIVMFINDQKYYQEFLDLHHAAVKKALDYIEANYLDYKYKNRILISNKGALFSVTDHFSSRDLDPQVHSHIMVFHNILSNTGKKTRLENHRLLKNIKHCGLIYRTEMLKLLAKSNIKVKITDRKNVFYELDGFKKEWLENFSKRTIDIKNRLKEAGVIISNSKLRKQFTLYSRKPKKNHSIEVLINEWKKQFKEFGINEFVLNQSKSSGNSQGENPKNPKGIDQYLNTIMKDLADAQMAFTLEELFYEAAKKSHERIITIDEVNDFITKEINRGRLLLGEIAEEQYYYTKESKLLEESIYKDLVKGVGVYRGISKSRIEELLINSDKRMGFTLTEDQKLALLYMANDNQFNFIQGSAGTGKSTILKEIKHDFESEGWNVEGICFSGIGAENIYLKSDIASSTIHSFLNRLEREAGNYRKTKDLKHKNEWNLNGLNEINRPQLWVIDEASMISNKLMAKLIEAAYRRHAKLCFIGDFKQLPSIGPGAVFTKIVQKKILPYADLKRHVRQEGAPDPIKKAVLFCEKSFLKSMDNPQFGDLETVKESVKAIKGNVQFIENDSLRLNVIASDFCSLKSSIRNNSVVITSQNSDRIELNNMIRETLKSNKELPRGKVFELLDRDDNPNSLELSVGDKVIFLSNERIYKQQVRNGTVGFIKMIKGDMAKIITQKGIVQCNLKDYRYLDHAYAITIHKSQCKTIPENVFLNLNKNQKRSNNLNAFYVSLTRSKKNISIYTNGNLSEISELIQRKQFKPSVLDITKESPTFHEEEFDRKLYKTSLSASTEHERDL